MDVIRHQQDQMSTRFESQSQFSFWVSKNRAVLALQAASVFFFLFIFLSLRVDFSALSISLLSLNLGRTHMFILCNGIVAILVKGSVLADPHDDHQDGDVAEQTKAKSDEASSAAKSVETEKSVVGIVEEEEEEKQDETAIGCALIAETVQIDQQLAQEDEEDGFGELSVEELNKKCDEFIRKMRGVISNGNMSL